jgi:SAM-dependent methyltransferase
MSPWRRELNRTLQSYELQGRMIDLGGDKRSDYYRYLPGVTRVEIVNLLAEAEPDHLFDLENKFQLPDAQYNGALCINILEHIYNHRQFLSECHRILLPRGKLLLAVPFLMQVHPSPHDYFRYTAESLERLLNEAGFIDIDVRPVGRGPFTAASHIAYNVLAKVPLLAPLHTTIAGLLDACLARFDTKYTFGPARYPLGYVVVAQKR